MDFETKTGTRQDDGSVRSYWSYEQCERMSRWRWLLFAAMARFEVPEHVYWRAPNAKTILHEVAVDIYPEPESRDPRTTGGQSWRVALDARPAPARLVSWLGKILRRRSPD